MQQMLHFTLERVAETSDSLFNGQDSSCFRFRTARNKKQEKHAAGRNLLQNLVKPASIPLAGGQNLNTVLFFSAHR